MTGVRIQLGVGTPGVELAALARAYPGGLWVFDDNWLLVELTVAGPRPWRYQSFLRCDDFAGFAGELGQLRAGGRRAGFWPRDPWLGCRIERDGAGFVLQVMLHENRSERHWEFTTRLSSADLAELDRQLLEWNAEFPVCRRSRAT